MCCALLERLGVRRASSSCRGRGWGGTPRGPCAATASATLERSTGTVAHGKRAASERRRRRSKVSRRRRAGHAPPARRGGVCACRARSNGWRRPCGGGWWWCAHQLRITSGRLPLCPDPRSGEVFYFNIPSIALGSLPSASARLSAVLAEKKKRFANASYSCATALITALIISPWKATSPQSP